MSTRVRPYHIYIAVEQPSGQMDCGTRKGVNSTPFFKYETILVCPQATMAEIKSAFLASADLAPQFASEVLMKLTNPKDGTVIAFSSEIPQNSPEARYRLSIDYTKLTKHKTPFENVEKMLLSGSEVNDKGITMTLDALKANIKSLEFSVRKMKVLKSTNINLSKRAPNSKMFMHNNKYVFSEETMSYLKLPSFDNWQWDDNEMMALLEHIFVDLGLVSEFQIEINTLRKFLLRIKESYNTNMYGIINSTGVVDKLTLIDKLILLVACIGHDSDHP
ncbi:High affinity cAMP-specific and IBMX-insensitive 3',5'-cyclic phosphodiesterase 9A, partial [Nowakowskiella sp. JEL0078]